MGSAGNGACWRFWLLCVLIMWCYGFLLQWVRCCSDIPLFTMFVGSVYDVCGTCDSIAHLGKFAEYLGKLAGVIL